MRLFIEFNRYKVILSNWLGTANSLQTSSGLGAKA